jgi:hypothetical protein
MKYNSQYQYNNVYRAHKDEVKPNASSYYYHLLLFVNTG